MENAADGNDVADLDAINYFSEELFGEDVGEFPGENEELFIAKNENGYYWSGDQMSIPDISKYFVKSMVEKENKYEVEILEYIVHEWSDGIWITNLKGEKIESFVSQEDYEMIQTNYDDLNKNIEIYVENNMEKFDSKVLTIEYSEIENLYRITSVR